MTNETTRRIAKTALMVALIFVCTFTIKLPNPATGGYTHMGDCMAFLAVLYLGKKDGALAAGLGAALSDLLTGAMIWVLPTFIFKSWDISWVLYLKREIMKKWIGLLELALVVCFNVSHIHYLRFLYLRQPSHLRLYLDF